MLSVDRKWPGILIGGLGPHQCVPQQVPGTDSDTLCPSTNALWSESAEAGRKQSIHFRGNTTGSDLTLRPFALALWDLLFTCNRALSASEHRSLSLSSHLALALVSLSPAPPPNKVIAVSKCWGGGEVGGRDLSLFQM